MSREPSLQLVEGEARPQLELGTGLHAARLCARAGELWQIQLLDGREATVPAMASVCPLLLEECLRRQRLVLLTEVTATPSIVGALQTESTPTVDAFGHLELKARTVSVQAEQELLLAGPKGRLEFDSAGLARLKSRRLVVDTPESMRVRSALVELP
jgi:hypothetical protein